MHSELFLCLVYFSYLGIYLVSLPFGFLKKALTWQLEPTSPSPFV